MKTQKFCILMLLSTSVPAPIWSFGDFEEQNEPENNGNEQQTQNETLTLREADRRMQEEAAQTRTALQNQVKTISTTVTTLNSSLINVKVLPNFVKTDLNDPSTLGQPASGSPELLAIQKSNLQKLTSNITSISNRIAKLNLNDDAAVDTLLDDLKTSLNQLQATHAFMKKWGLFPEDQEKNINTLITNNDALYTTQVEVINTYRNNQALLLGNINPDDDQAAADIAKAFNSPGRYTAFKVFIRRIFGLGDGGGLYKGDKQAVSAFRTISDDLNKIYNAHYKDPGFEDSRVKTYIKTLTEKCKTAFDSLPKTVQKAIRAVSMDGSPYDALMKNYDAITKPSPLQFRATIAEQGATLADTITANQAQIETLSTTLRDTLNSVLQPIIESGSKISVTFVFDGSSNHFPLNYVKIFIPAELKSIGLFQKTLTEINTAQTTQSVSAATNAFASKLENLQNIVNALEGSSDVTMSPDQIKTINDALTKLSTIQTTQVDGIKEYQRNAVLLAGGIDPALASASDITKITNALQGVNVVDPVLGLFDNNVDSISDFDLIRGSKKEIEAYKEKIGKAAADFDKISKIVLGLAKNPSPVVKEFAKNLARNLKQLYDKSSSELQQRVDGRKAPLRSLAYTSFNSMVALYKLN